MSHITLSNICRTCLVRTDSKSQSIFHQATADISLHLSEMLTAFTSVQISNDDGLPHEVCVSCAEHIIKMYQFKQKCETSDKLLREKVLNSYMLRDENLERLINERKSNYDDDLDETPNSIDFNFDQMIVKSEYAQDVVKNESPIDNQLTVNRETTDDTSSDNDMFECTRCLKILTSRNDLSNHFVRCQSSQDQFECTKCQKQFSCEKTFDEHKAIHGLYKATIIRPVEGLEKHNNDVCTFSNDCAQDENESNELRDRYLADLTCGICSESFNYKSEMMRHAKIHLQPYTCPTCNKVFPRSQLLVNHVNSHLGLKPHICEICLKGFNQVSNLKDHLRTHNGEKPYLCATCGKSFNQLGNFKQHTIRHSGVKAYVCEMCSSAFASKGELTAHLRKHTGARPFVCPICNHGFTTSSSLTKHKRIHSGEKPYECEVCKMRFSRTGILSRHRRTHTGEKPYTCDYCNKSFAQSNDLTTHLRIHTGEKPYICEECGLLFRQNSALRTHKKVHYSDRIKEILFCRS